MCTLKIVVHYYKIDVKVEVESTQKRRAACLYGQYIILQQTFLWEEFLPIHPLFHSVWNSEQFRIVLKRWCPRQGPFVTKITPAAAALISQCTVPIEMYTIKCAPIQEGAKTFCSSCKRQKAIFIIYRSHYIVTNGKQTSCSQILRIIPCYWFQVETLLRT